MSEKKFRLLKFGAKWCGACNAMARARTLEKFNERHPEVTVELIDIPDDVDDHGKPLKLTQEELEIVELADEWDIRSLPALIFVPEDNLDFELARSDEATTLSGLEKLYARALGAWDAYSVDDSEEDEGIFDEDQDDAEDDEDERDDA